MFLKVKSANNKQYLSLVESYWDKQANKSRQRTVASLGCLENFSNDQLEAIGRKMIALAGKCPPAGPSKHDLTKLKEEGRYNWGAKAIFTPLWEKFKLTSFLNKVARKNNLQYNLSETILKIVLARILAPSSKLQAYLNQDFYLGLEQVPLHQYYRCLDHLSDYKDDLEKHVFEFNKSLFNMSVDLVFYDVTTLHFESVKSDELRNFGYSKACKFNEVQVVLGLLIDKEGRPIGFDTYPGNTFEGHTLVTALDKLSKKFNLENVIIVADRGLNSKMNLNAIKEAGYHYVVSSKLKSLPKSITEVVLDIERYREISSSDNDETFKIYSFDYENNVTHTDENGKRQKIILKEKIHCSWSSKRARKDKKDRQRLVDKAQRIIDSPSTHEESRGAKKYIKAGKSETLPTLNSEKIERDEQWDGFYGIQCSNLALTTEEVINSYKNLWRIEEAFRVLKSSMNIRPIYHWNQKRIKGHLVTCFIAFLLERTLELTLRRKEIDYSTERVRQSVNR